MRFSPKSRPIRIGSPTATVMSTFSFWTRRHQAAADAFHAVKDKVNDYFTRCQLAAYDARAAGPLSRSTEDYQHIAAQNLSAQNTDIAGFPLATVEPNKPLPLNSGINPAWQSQIEALRKQVIEPVFGKRDGALASEWAELCAKFAAFEAWQAAKPACCAEELGNARLREIAQSRYKEAIDQLDQPGQGSGGRSQGDPVGGTTAALSSRPVQAGQ